MATFVDSNGKIHSCELCLKYPETPECVEQCPTSQDPPNAGGASPTLVLAVGLPVAVVLVLLLVLAALWWYKKKHVPPHPDNVEAPVQEQADLLTKPKYMVNHANTQTHEPVEADQRPLAGPEPVEDDYLPIRETAEGTSINASPHTFA
ncbi:uncharacterized protein LOC144880990 [Branchiostoma floridae x Branchiostoma japonicum]